MSDVETARDHLLEVAQAYVEARGESPDDQYYGDHLDYVGDGLAHAARDLYYAIEELLRDDRPVGWNPKPKDGRMPVTFTRDEMAFFIRTLRRRQLFGDQYGMTNRLLDRLTQEYDAFDRHPEVAS